MRSNSIPTSLWALGAITILQSVAASWIPDLFQSFDVLNTPEKRCDNPCGYYGTLCCAAGQVCFTDSNNQAQCGSTVGGSGSGGSQNQNGQWQYFTTTYVMTDLQTITTTFSSFVPYATAPPTNTMQCAYSQGQQLCGNVCCLAGQYCSSPGSCVQVPGGSSQYYSNLATITTVVTNTASPGIRPTTQTILTLTSTGTASGTTGFQSAVGTGGAVLSGAEQSGGGLSGGAIAGIVIGVIIGIIILILICACCLFKGLIDGLLAIFGLGPRKKRRTEETYIEERRSHHSGVGRTWWGQPKRTEVIEEKKSSSIARFASVAGILGSLALILGLKRRRERKDDVSSVSYGSSDYYYDYGSATSPSSVTRSRSRSRSRYSRSRR